MSGHNKWSKIKRKKAVEDVRRSKQFTKVLKEITVAVKEGGPEASTNPRLRLALSNARAVNLPKDNILRAIHKGSESGGAHYSEITYEGYGPGGVAIFVETSTDNINRTVQSVRNIFSKCGGSLGTNGSLDFIFERKGVFTFPLGTLDIDVITLELIDAGAEDVEAEDEMITVTTAFSDFGTIQKKLESMKIQTENAGLERIPRTAASADLNTARQVMRLIDALEDDDDIQAVYHNMEMTEELSEQLS